jgi:acetyl-CoA C-acetyltransferase
MAEAFVYDHVRTPRGRGRANGSLHGTPPIELAAQVLRALRDRNRVDTTLVDDVVLGCVTPIGEQGSDIARAAVLVAGYDETVPGVQLDRFCASGLEAVNTAAAAVMSGQKQLVIGGGVESMSRVPMGSQGGAWSADPAVTYATYFAPQGISADLIATRAGFSRRDVDAYAVESQRRAANAWDKGYFNGSVIPVVDALGLPVLSRDEHIRAGTTLEDLGRLEPSFAAMGT